MTPLLRLHGLNRGVEVDDHRRSTGAAHEGAWRGGQLALANRRPLLFTLGPDFVLRAATTSRMMAMSQPTMNAAFGEPAHDNKGKPAAFAWRGASAGNRISSGGRMAGGKTC